MHEAPKDPVKMFAVTDQGVDAVVEGTSVAGSVIPVQNPQNNEKSKESPPAKDKEAPTPEPQKSKADIFFEKYGSQSETFAKYSKALDFLIKPGVNQILSDDRLINIVLGQALPSEPKVESAKQDHVPSVSSIEIPEFSDDDLSDPSMKKFAKGFQAMKQVLEHQNTIILKSQADQEQQAQNTQAFNGQVLLASQMGASNPIEFVRAASTREWQQKAAEMQIQMWNAMNDKTATPAPAPVANTQAQDILSRLEKEPDVPIPGADGGGSDESDPAKNFFKVKDTGSPMFPI